MANPVIPPVGAHPIIPPSRSLPIGKVTIDGREYPVQLSLGGFTFLQQLWAALQGQGGVVDTTDLLESDFIESSAAVALDELTRLDIPAPARPGTHETLVGLIANLEAAVTASVLDRVRADVTDALAALGLPVLGTLAAQNAERVTLGQVLLRESFLAMGKATLAAGTVVVNNASVTAASRIQLTSQNNGGGGNGALRVSARVAGTSFTITSSDATDTSDVAWLLLEPGSPA